MGHGKLLVPILRGDDALGVCWAEVVCVTESCLCVLKLELSGSCSFCSCESGVGLLIRDDRHIVGGKPSPLLTEQTIPPPGFQPGENLDNVVSAKREGGVIIGLIVEEGTTEKGREELFLFRLLLSGVGGKRHGLCPRVEDFSGHSQTQCLA